MFHVVPERAHDVSRWRLFVAQEVKVSGVLDEIIICPECIYLLKNMVHKCWDRCSTASKCNISEDTLTCFE